MNRFIYFAETAVNRENQPIKENASQLNPQRVTARALVRPEQKPLEC